MRRESPAPTAAAAALAAGAAGEGREYFAQRKMGRDLLANPFDERWWRESKYRTALERLGGLPKPGARVLDLGCGLGATAYRLAALAGHVTGIDLSEFAIGFAREHYRRENLRFERADVLEYEPPQPFDAAFCMDVIEHLDPGDGLVLVRRIASLLAPEGVLFAHVPIAESAGGRRKLAAYRRKHPDAGEEVRDHTGDPTHRATFSVASFGALLRAGGLEVERAWRKTHAWRPVRGLAGALLAIPLAPAAWRDAATYSVVVRARRRREP
jgi:2-polyprenyl-3-methyl-5-hydroxy-6-metoxy-1,4-benzoquinol methylase